MVLITGGRYAGKMDYARRCFPGYRICGRYQERVRELLDDGADPWAEAALLIEEEKLAVLMDEIGCGLVPVDADDRLFREKTAYDTPQGVSRAAAANAVAGRQL